MSYASRYLQETETNAEKHASICVLFLFHADGVERATGQSLKGDK
jgi:hypothetical protein